MSAAEPSSDAAGARRTDAADDGQSTTAFGPLGPGQWNLVRPEDLTWNVIGPNVTSTDASAVDEASGEADEGATPDPVATTLRRRQQLEHHIKLHPTDLDSFLELSSIYRHERRPLEARRVLGQALEIFPDDSTLRWEHEEATLARSLQQLREVSELATKLDTAETDRELRRARQNWANQRIEVCSARLKRNPDLPHLRLALGEALYEAELFDEAFLELGEIVDDPQHAPSAHLVRARCQIALKDDLAAMSSLRSCAMRRSMPAPPRIRAAALRMLCEIAQRLGIPLMLKRYRHRLEIAEDELEPANASEKTS